MTTSGDRDLARVRLLRVIADGGFRAGERLGGERQLADDLGFSRAVLRQAIASLEIAGRVRRSMGRNGGVLVDDGRIERNVNTIEGVPAMLRQQGFAVSTDILRQEMGIATPMERRNLKLPESDSVCRVVRLRWADGIPWSLDTSVLPAARFPGISAMDLSGSLYETLRTVFGVVPLEADETLDFVEADDEQAELLQISPGATLVQVWRVTRCEPLGAFEFARDLFRADRSRFHLRKHPSSWKRTPRSPHPTGAS